VEHRPRTRKSTGIPGRCNANRGQNDYLNFFSQLLVLSPTTKILRRCWCYHQQLKLPGIPGRWDTDQGEENQPAFPVGETPTGDRMII